ncbi:MAG: hypothetical protein AAFX05_06810 [Planctomycetota bacterium]
MRITQLAAVTLVTTMLAPAALAEKVTIAEIAPPSAAVIIGVDDFSTMKAAFDRTGFRAIWDEPSVQEWVEEMSEEMLEEFTDMLDELDADMEDISTPTGAAGAALWLVETDPDADEAQTPMHTLAFGDFGDGADDMHKTIMSAFEKGQDEDSIVLTEDTFGDATIYTVKMLELEEDDVDEMDDEWADWEEDWGDDDPFQLDTMFYARADNHLFMCTSLSDLENALERVAGERRASAFDSADFSGVRSKFGAHHAYAVVLNAPLYELADSFDRANEDDPAGNPPIMPLLDALGLSDVKAFGMSLTFDGDVGMVESTLAVLLPRKRGIFSLIDVPEQPLTPPAFANADASSVGMFQFDIAGLLPLLQNIANTLPPEMGQQMLMSLTMAQQMAQPILSNLGPEMYTVSSYAQPLNAESQRMLFAIKAKDTNALSNALGANLGMFGLRNREFQGGQIWQAPEGGGGPMAALSQIAIGVGAGFFMVGDTLSVESAMRQAAMGDAASLGNEARFVKAARAIRKSGLAFSYSNTRREVEYYNWLRNNVDTVVDAQMDAMFGADLPADERAMIADEMRTQWEWLSELPDLGVISRHIGDTIGEFHLTDDGIIGRTFMLRPAE